MLREALTEAGERFYSTLGFAAAILAGPIWVVWDTFAFAQYFTLEHGGEIAPALVSLGPFLNLLLWVAVALTYFAAAAYTVSLARAGLLGRKGSLAYAVLNIVALSLVVIAIADHPSASDSISWYIIPGFILSVPALPLIMPALLGAVLLRRAGNEEGD